MTDCNNCIYFSCPCQIDVTLRCVIEIECWSLFLAAVLFCFLSFDLHITPHPAMEGFTPGFSDNRSDVACRSFHINVYQRCLLTYTR